MSISIYHDEYGNVKPPSAFTEFAGGILDSYYHRISAVEQEIEHLQQVRDGLQRSHDRVSQENETLTDDRDTLRKEAKAAEARAVTVKAQIEAQATEIARLAKVIEQYAAWRVAVREALKDLDVPLDGIRPADEKWDSNQVQNAISVLKRIAELTAEKDQEEV